MTRHCRVKLVRWVAENLRPYEIVSDRGFQCLMKTGRPGYYLTHPSTISRDLKVVFKNVRNQVARMLRISHTVLYNLQLLSYSLGIPR